MYGHVRCPFSHVLPPPLPTHPYKTQSSAVAPHITNNNAGLITLISSKQFPFIIDWSDRSSRGSSAKHFVGPDAVLSERWAVTKTEYVTVHWPNSGLLTRLCMSQCATDVNASPSRVNGSFPRRKLKRSYILRVKSCCRKCASLR